ncbi:Cyclin-U4-3 [Porphyridium purpureum]|uniref:Cyclin-U4-3 n=1 Tax=Porphyridium purpureum TaxID=35688 RepID=A0A5J4Z3U4_PORPP|nr:Cyclin-U4-3 [Porphyridium purpureum]|eukprot:POR7697..scf295_1
MLLSIGSDKGMPASDARVAPCGFLPADSTSTAMAAHLRSSPIGQAGPSFALVVNPEKAKRNRCSSDVVSQSQVGASSLGSDSKAQEVFQNFQGLTVACGCPVSESDGARSSSMSLLPVLADGDLKPVADLTKSISTSALPALGEKKGIPRSSSSLTPPLGSATVPVSHLQGGVSRAAQESESKRARNNFPLAYALAMSLREECFKVKERKALARKAALSGHEVSDGEDVFDFPPWCEVYDPFYSPVVRSADNPYAWSALDIVGPTTERERRDGLVMERAENLLQDDKVNGSLVGCTSYVLRYARCSVSAYAVALQYLRRLARLPEFEDVISIDTVWRVFLVCVLISSKYLDDRVHSNQYYAEIANTTNEHLNRLEVMILEALDYRLYVSTRDYKEIERELALSALSSHGVLRNKTIEQGALFPQFTMAERSPRKSGRKGSFGGSQ